ncbi:BTAD domain-containing putative transcriptional regulator [Nonomuraea sp. NPDC046802]|uniref:AfsR/SARP family transcriptional regulator n=1 Tax=Nonomuraea sp. NPDC046802 TaxID=3154919 RepID=UPI0033D3E323
MSVRFGVLGPLRVDGGRTPGPAKHRALLAALLLSARERVPIERLMSVVWDDRPPASAESVLRVYVSALRKLVDGIRTVPGGYLFEVEPDDVDCHRFERLVAGARQARAAGQVGEAADGFRAALGLWRGQVLADVESSVLRRAYGVPLEELRLTALEERVQLDLRLGRGAEVVGELRALVGAHPLRERAWVRLIEALQQAGRRSEALGAYQDARRVLVEELGLEPGAELAEAHHRVLTDETTHRGPAQHGTGDAGSALYGPAREGSALYGPAHASSASYGAAHAGSVSDGPAREGSALYGPAHASSASYGAAHAGSVSDGSAHAGSSSYGAAPSGRFRIGRAPVNELPPDISDFAGRAAVLDWIADTVRDHDSAPVHLVLHGPPGCGKSAVAVHAATALDGPDGRLYASLGARPPGAVLEDLLRTLGCPDGALPPALDERVRLYRSMTAGRKLLVVLDDAADEAQVRPLLPTGPGSLTLVTSRSPLAGLEAARAYELGVLDEDEAVTMLGGVAGHERIRAEPDAARCIARLCGYLPLALRIAGSRLARKPGWTLDHLAGRLSDERRRLDELSAGDLAVRGSLTLGYRGLPDQERRLLRALGALSAPDFAPWALGADLEPLAEAGLLQSRGLDEAGQERYGWHDLTRLYAAERLAEEDGGPAAVLATRAGTILERTRLARESLLPAEPGTGRTEVHTNTPADPPGPYSVRPGEAPVDGYGARLGQASMGAHGARPGETRMDSALGGEVRMDADSALAGEVRMDADSALAGEVRMGAGGALFGEAGMGATGVGWLETGRLRQEARWLSAERRFLVATVEDFFRAGLYEETWRLAFYLTPLFELGAHHDDWHTTTATGLDAARAAGHRHGEALLLRGLADLHRAEGRTEAAAAALRAAQPLVEGLELARITLRLGLVQAEARPTPGPTKQAPPASGQAAEGHPASGQVAESQPGPGRADGRPASGQAMMGRSSVGQVAEGQPGPGRVVEGWSGFGGRLGEAERAFVRALRVFEEAGDRRGRADALRALGALRQDEAPLNESLAAYQNLGDPRGEAEALLDLARVHLAAGRHPRARDCAERRLRINRRLGDRLPEAAARLVLAEIALAEGVPDASAQEAREALETFTAFGSRRSAAHALLTLARAALDLDDADGAVDALTRAMGEFDGLGDPHGRSEAERLRTEAHRRRDQRI